MSIKSKNDDLSLDLSPRGAKLRLPLQTRSERMAALLVSAGVLAAVALATLGHAQTATVIDNSNGGVGADVTVHGGGPGSNPVTGFETHGLIIRQSGPGTGMRIVVDGNGGPVSGVRSTVIVGAPQN